MAVYTFPLGDEIKKLAENAINEAIKNKFVPVVRCEDCKHSYHTLVGDSESDYRCVLACSELDDREVDPEWFCADGEVREDNEADLLL